MLHYSAGIWTVIRDSDAGAISDEAQKPTGNCGYRQAYRAVRSFASNDYYAGVEQYGICLPHEYSFRHNIHSYGVHLPNPIYGMDGAATDDLWIVGAGGGIYHWDGSTVTQVH